MKIIRNIIFSIIFLFPLYSQCNECEVVWWDDYWGEQCCDAAWDQWGFDCADMEEQYGWDCTECNCPYDSNPICGDTFCTGEENIDNCLSDCTTNGCNTSNHLDDCADDDCCPLSWYGDGYCDDGQWGCDLRCYNNDGGDCPAQNGDINNDGMIDVLDIIITVDAILDYEFHENMDFNFDSIVNVQDVIILINIILIN